MHILVQHLGVLCLLDHFNHGVPVGGVAIQWNYPEKIKVKIKGIYIKQKILNAITLNRHFKKQNKNLWRKTKEQVQTRISRGHESSSWEEFVKHSPPSILEQLTQLIETTALSPLKVIVTQSPNKEKYFCSRAITVDIGPDQKPIAPCYEVRAEEVRLYWNLT